MPTRKIANLPEPVICRHPEHIPPTMVVLEPGLYEHVCPACGFRVEFMVPQGPRLSA